MSSVIGTQQTRECENNVGKVFMVVRKNVYVMSIDIKPRQLPFSSASKSLSGLL